MKNYIIIILLFLIPLVGVSQYHEVGFFVGGSNLIGDIGSTQYIAPNKVSGGFIYKYNLNYRVALRGTYMFLPIEGNDKNASNAYRKQRGFNFSNTIHELAAGVEFSFFEYDPADPVVGYTPYILAEIACFSYKSPVSYDDKKLKTKNNYSFTMPVGIGFKGRLTDNIAFAIEAGVRFTFKDDLDFTTSKVNNLNFGGTGNDHYVFTGISLVYAFGRSVCYYEIKD